MAAGHGGDPARWQEAFEGLMNRIVGRFARVEPRRRVGELMGGAAVGPATQRLLEHRRVGRGGHPGEGVKAKSSGGESEPAADSPEAGCGQLLA
ncbi:hypothetical protein DXZ75_04555 [Streptomyces sp. AcE210]|nr:hypothetical protein DXZ75_04555 [Streptomyces sp. AcE210]